MCDRDSDAHLPDDQGGGQAVTDTLATTRVMPVVTIENAEWATKLGATLVEAGLPIAEVMFRTPAAASALAALAETPGLLVGAGTILTPDQVDEAVDAGARFIVTPGFSSDVVRRCDELGVPVFPGVSTATDVMSAHAHGLRVVKFFPAAAAGGPASIEALSAPFSQMRFIPTGGISAQNIDAYLAVPSVLAVGGSWMVPTDGMRRGDFDAIRSLATAAVARGAAAV